MTQEYKTPLGVGHQALPYSHKLMESRAAQPFIVAGHQPSYLPWLGYFDKIRKADIFIFSDNVEREKGRKAFINSQRLKMAVGQSQGKEVWLTVPLRQASDYAKINELRIDHSQRWAEEHLKTIYLNYKKTPYFDVHYPELESLYRYVRGFDLLADMLYYHLHFWLHKLGDGSLVSRLVRASQLEGIDPSLKGSNLVLERCRLFDATHYLAGSQAARYINVAEFENAGVMVAEQNFQHPVYQQLYGDFLPNMGIVDYWMNCNYLPPRAAPMGTIAKLDAKLFLPFLRDMQTHVQGEWVTDKSKTKSENADTEDGGS